MERVDMDWGSLGFGYVQTDKRFVANYKDGAWDAGELTDKATIEMKERIIKYLKKCLKPI